MSEGPPTRAAGLRIPFNRVALQGKELAYIAEAVERGHLSGDGDFTRRCSEWLESELGAQRVLLTTSCSDALELCALLLDLQPGDEVIVPSFAFVTTAGAFALHGARPVFADVRADTLCVDPASVEARLSPRTRAIVALHYGGVPCEVDALRALADRAGALLIEDNAHGLFGRLRGRPLGSFGQLATQSFHETKNVTCGEGGALVLNDAALADRAEVLREKGTDRARFQRGEVAKYTWVDRGSSYLPSEILAAFLWAQLEASERIQAERATLWSRYAEGLGDWASAQGVALPVIPRDCEPPHHLFHLLLPSEADRDTFLAHLRERGILAVFHYQPLHRSVMAARLGSDDATCPVTDRVSATLARLPLYNGLEARDQEAVVDAVRAFHTA